MGIKLTEYKNRILASLQDSSARAQKEVEEVFEEMEIDLSFLDEKRQQSEAHVRFLVKLLEEKNQEELSQTQ